MKNKILVIVAVMLMAHCAIAQDTTFSSEYFKLIKTYNTLDEVYLAHPDLKPAPPKIVINEDEVLFYNDNREVVNRMPLVREDEIPVDDPKFEEYGDSKKIIRNYKVIDDELLGVWESYGYWDGEHTINKRAMIFNGQGEFLSFIKRDHIVITSPDKKQFASFSTNVEDTIFIFDMQGKLLSGNFTHYIYGSCEFCNHSNILKTHDTHTSQIMAFDFLINKKVVDYNYLESLEGMVFDYYVYEELNSMLVSTFPNVKVFLIDLDGNIVWAINYPTIENSYLINDSMFQIHARETIVDPENYLNYVSLLDIHTGRIVAEIKCKKILFFKKGKFLIEKKGGYFEYEIN